MPLKMHIYHKVILGKLYATLCSIFVHYFKNTKYHYSFWLLRFKKRNYGKYQERERGSNPIMSRGLGSSDRHRPLQGTENRNYVDRWCCCMHVIINCNFLRVYCTRLIPMTRRSIEPIYIFATHFHELYTFHHNHCSGLHSAVLRIDTFLIFMLEIHKKSLFLVHIYVSYTVNLASRVSI